MIFIIDASALVELLIGGTARAGTIARRLGAAAAILHAPHVIDLEVLSSLRKLGARGASSTIVASAVAALPRAPVTRHPHRPFVQRIWQLRGNLTPYDAGYVALAETLGAPLITCDGNLARSPGHAAVIEHY